MAEIQDKVLEKIRKLLALGNSPNEAEAAAAIAKAHAILLEYNLSIDDVDTDDQIVVENEYEHGSHIRTYKKNLLSWICRANFSKLLLRNIVYQNNNGRKNTVSGLCIVGRFHNILSTKAMADYLFNAIESLTKRQYGEGKEFVYSYKLGVADNLIVRFEQICKKDEEDNSGSKELVVSSEAEIDNYLDKVGTTQVQHGRKSPKDSQAYNQGRVDGDRINLNKQLQGEMSQTLRLI